MLKSSIEAGVPLFASVSEDVFSISCYMDPNSVFVGSQCQVAVVPPRFPQSLWYAYGIRTLTLYPRGTDVGTKPLRLSPMCVCVLLHSASLLPNVRENGRGSHRLPA